MTATPIAEPELDHLAELDEPALATLFTAARTANSFDSRPVADDKLRAIWDLARWAPTAANTQPLRVMFVREPAGKERLLRHMNEGNQAKTASAPVTAVLAVDGRFHDHLPTVMPHRPEMRDSFEQNEAMRDRMGRFNATLQAGYFILAVRAQGLAAGPMAGFDGAGIDAEFFADNGWNSILVVNIGYPGPNPWFHRLPRLESTEVVRWA